MTRYQAGTKFEYKVRDALKAQGAIYVCRSAGSKGPVDLIAFYGWNSVRSSAFVQAKRDGRISRADRWALIELAQQCGAEPVLAKAGPRGTPVVLETLTSEKAAA